MAKKVFIFVAIISSFLISCANGKTITLAWDSITGPCDQVNIYRGYSEGQWPELVGTALCTDTTYDDVSIPNGDLFWAITAVSGQIESNASNEVQYAFYYAKTKYDYDAQGRILYKGEHQDINAADSDSNWVISKYYYSGNGNLIEVRVRTTSWTNRATGW